MRWFTDNTNVPVQIREKREKKLKPVSNLVWVYLKAMITEKTLKEECTNKIISNDNYSYCNIISEGCIKTDQNTEIKIFFNFNAHC
mgnify:CR=1 FL=1